MVHYSLHCALLLWIIQGKGAILDAHIFIHTGIYCFIMKKPVNGADLSVDPQGMSQAEGVLLALLSHIHMLVDTISHLQQELASQNNQSTKQPVGP